MVAWVGMTICPPFMPNDVDQAGSLTLRSGGQSYYIARLEQPFGLPGRQWPTLTVNPTTDILTLRSPAACQELTTTPRTIVKGTQLLQALPLTAVITIHPTFHRLHAQNEASTRKQRAFHQPNEASCQPNEAA